ncbi:unnamed protein product, partial [Ectocarpus sp. 13 AM-2016]
SGCFRCPRRTTRQPFECRLTKKAYRCSPPTRTRSALPPAPIPVLAHVHEAIELDFSVLSLRLPEPAPRCRRIDHLRHGLQAGAVHIRSSGGAWYKPLLPPGYHISDRETSVRQIAVGRWVLGLSTRMPTWHGGKTLGLDLKELS